MTQREDLKLSLWWQLGFEVSQPCAAASLLPCGSNTHRSAAHQQSCRLCLHSCTLTLEDRQWLPHPYPGKGILSLSQALPRPRRGLIPHYTTSWLCLTSEAVFGSQNAFCLLSWQPLPSSLSKASPSRCVGHCMPVTSGPSCPLSDGWSFSTPW
jgi:hypothetical protein